MNDLVAQLVEQMTLNHWVEGSSPSGVTRQNIKMHKTSEIGWISEVFPYPPPGFRRKIIVSAQCELHAFFVNNLWLTEQNKSYFIQYNDLIK